MRIIDIISDQITIFGAFALVLSAIAYKGGYYDGHYNGMEEICELDVALDDDNKYICIDMEEYNKKVEANNEKLNKQIRGDVFYEYNQTQFESIKFK